MRSNPEAKRPWWASTVWVTVALACSKPESASTTAQATAALDTTATDTAHVAVARPTVIAYFVVPRGAVDTMPNLAVEADDWNVAMATLRDSLEAGRMSLAMTTEPTVWIEAANMRAVVLSLGPALSSGYVFVGPGSSPCVRRGGADQAELLATARRFFTRVPSPADTSSERCAPKSG